MATVTVTFTDVDEEKGSVQIKMESEPGFEDGKGTAAQHMGAKMLELLNQQLDKEDAEEDDCCHHGGCGCHDVPENAVAPKRREPIRPSNGPEIEMMGS